jgi:hypothetical protein
VVLPLGQANLNANAFGACGVQERYECFLPEKGKARQPIVRALCMWGELYG